MVNRDKMGICLRYNGHHLRYDGHHLRYDGHRLRGNGHCLRYDGYRQRYNVSIISFNRLSLEQYRLPAMTETASSTNYEL